MTSSLRNAAPKKTNEKQPGEFPRFERPPISRAVCAGTPVYPLLDPIPVGSSAATW